MVLTTPLYALHNTQKRRCGNCGRIHDYLTWLCRTIVTTTPHDLVRFGPSWAGFPVLLPLGYAEPLVPLDACVKRYRVVEEKVLSLLLPKKH